MPHVPIRRQLREAVEAARVKDPGLTWAVLAERAGLESRSGLRKMLQGEAPMDDETAGRIAAVVGYELALVQKKGRKK